MYIVTLVIATTLAAHAQSDLVDKAAQSAQAGNYEEAKTSIDLAVADPAAAKEAATWYYFGFIYKALYKAKEIDNPGSPLRKSALDAFGKSLELEANSKYAAGCKQSMKFLVNTIYNDAVKALNKQDFQQAFDNYESYIEAERIVNPAGLTDKVIFYAGYSAYMINNYDGAVKYLNEVKAKDYNDPLLYFFLGKLYHDNEKVDQALEVLQEGKEKHPLAKDINDLYITYKLERGELTELETELQKAINLSPENLELRVTLALLYEKKAELDRDNAVIYLDKAKAVYKEIIEKNKDHMRANYNLALLFYNQAVNIMNNMDDDEEDLFALNEIQDQCIELFGLALPYFNKAHELDPTNKEVLIGLGGVHFSLNDMEKSEEYKAKLQELQGSDKNN